MRNIGVTKIGLFAQSRQDRWKCSLCISFLAKNLKGVVRHVVNVHAHDSNFRICYGVDGCHRTYRKFVSYKKHTYEKHIKISHASGAGLLQPEDMEVLSDDRQDGFVDDDSISLTSH